MKLNKLDLKKTQAAFDKFNKARHILVEDMLIVLNRIKQGDWKTDCSETNFIDFYLSFKDENEKNIIIFFCLNVEDAENSSVMIYVNGREVMDSHYADYNQDYKDIFVYANFV